MPERLKAEILQKYKSVHAFCKAHPELPRGVVYQLVSGKYPGKWSAQAEKVRLALSGDHETEKNAPKDINKDINGEILAQALQLVRCGNCRRLGRRECLACRDQTAREGEELFRRLFLSDKKEIPGAVDQKGG